MFRRILYLGIVLSICGNVISLYAGDYEELQKLVASDRAQSDRFAYNSISISGNYAIVGAYLEDEDALNSNTLDMAGSAYIYYWNGTNWTQQAKIVASDRATGDYFGYSVSISGDYAIVGAYQEDEDASNSTTLLNSGSAYIFKRDGTSWTQEAKIVASDRASSDYFGYSVSISGNYAIVGAYSEDEDGSGYNSMDNAGSAYIFYWNGASWTQRHKIVASDRAAYDNFGKSVSISGDYAIIGATGEDPGSISNAGSAYIYMRDDTYNVFFYQDKISASDPAVNDNFGTSVSISGNYAIVGTPWECEDASGNNTLSSAGSAYIFMRDGTSWDQQTKIVASDRATMDYFGYSVAISGDYAVVGAYSEDENALAGSTKDQAGSAYIFKRNETNWGEEVKVVASDRASYDQFGRSVAISSDYAFVGACSEYTSSAVDNAGSAYIFSLASDTPLPIELNSFNIELLNGSVKLSWKTESETNNAHFLIYRNDEVIATVDGAGTTSEPHDYEYIDDQVIPGNTYTYILADVSYANEEIKYTDKVVTVTVPEYDIPTEFVLGDNIPNPFNPTTTIDYELSSENDVELSIFDMNGKKVATLVNGHKLAGYYETNWDASNQPSGIYFYRLIAGSFIETKKMVLMK